MYYYGIIVSYNGAVTFDREHKSSEQETNTTGGLNKLLPGFLLQQKHIWLTCIIMFFYTIILSFV